MIEPEPQPQQRSHVDHSAILANEIRRSIATGWRVEYQSATEVILVRPNSPQHVVHALLTLLTVGLWLPVWLVIALNAGTGAYIERVSVTVDEHGDVTDTRL